MLGQQGLFFPLSYSCFHWIWMKLEANWWNLIKIVDFFTAERKNPPISMRIDVFQTLPAAWKPARVSLEARTVNWLHSSDWIPTLQAAVMRSRQVWGHGCQSVYWEDNLTPKTGWCFRPELIPNLILIEVFLAFFRQGDRSWTAIIENIFHWCDLFLFPPHGWFWLMPAGLKIIPPWSLYHQRLSAGVWGELGWQCKLPGGVPMGTEKNKIDRYKDYFYSGGDLALMWLY